MKKINSYINTGNIFSNKIICDIPIHKLLTFSQFEIYPISLTGQILNSVKENVLH